MSLKSNYSSSIREEGLKNRVAKDWFSPFDCTRIIGNIDFCVDIPATELALGYEAEPVLWAEAKAGNRRDIVASVEYHWGNDLSGSRGGAAGVGGVGRSPTFKNQIFSDPFEAQLRGALGAAVTEPCFQAVGVDSRLRSKGG